jgi:hypothetical protein
MQLPCGSHSPRGSAAEARAAHRQAQVEDGDKIIMPASCLDMLARLRISYPMLFEVTIRRVWIVRRRSLRKDWAFPVELPNSGAKRIVGLSS